MKERRRYPLQDNASPAAAAISEGEKSVVPCRVVFAFLLFSAALLLAGNVVRAEDAIVNVQAVAASDPGKKVTVPASLKAYEPQLKDSPFGTFTDAGHDVVKATAGAGGSVTLAGFAVEIAAMGKAEKGRAKVQITIKENGKPIGAPMKTELTSGHPMMMKAGDPQAPKIFFFTLKDE